MMEDATRDHMLQMAIEISRLRAENEKLREERDAARMEVIDVVRENEKLRAALKPFADMAQYCDNMQISENQCLFLEDLRAAAAALKETGDE